jgi:hypothetical protein
VGLDGQPVQRPVPEGDVAHLALEEALRRAARRKLKAIDRQLIEEVTTAQ